VGFLGHADLQFDRGQQHDERGECGHVSGHAGDADGKDQHGRKLWDCLPSNEF